MPEPPLAPSPLPPPPAPAEDVWSVDERSLTVFAEQLRGAPADRAWYDLRREAERIALVPGFDRLITLDANAIKELPHQIDVAPRLRRYLPFHREDRARLHPAAHGDAAAERPARAVQPRHPAAARTARHLGGVPRRAPGGR